MLAQSIIGFSSKAYQSLGQAEKWAEEVVAGLKKRGDSGEGAYICVPYPVLPLMVDWLSETKMDVGVQDVSQFSYGAHTGEVVAELLVDLGCKYVMIGHPERRRDNGETPDLVAAKVKAAVDAGLVPILVVGEDDPNADVEAKLASQIEVALGQASNSADVLLAYEPSWAIGKANSAPGEHIAASVALARRLVADRPGARVVYGGSAKPGTFKSIVDACGGDVSKCPDGVFLGRAGLEAQEFLVTLDEVRANKLV